MEFWKRNPAIYEINTWVWLSELGQQAGKPVTLGDVPDQVWDELQQLQVDAVWFMGVWERSPKGIQVSNRHEGNLSDFRRALPDFSFADNVGSPYCVKKYVVDPHLGGDEGLAAARQQLARRGIKIILDFVPNHVAHDNPWVKSYPDFFIQGNKEDLRDDPITFVQIGGHIFACGKDPFYPAWQDVLQLNTFHAGLRAEILGTLKRLADMCDGIRCDMAMLVLNDIFEQTWGKRAGTKPLTEFWREMIPAVKRVNKDFIFIAEAYWDKEWELQQQGFDFCYDKRLYDRLEHETAVEVRSHLTADSNFQTRLIRFIENHDEPRSFALFHADKLKAAAIIAMTLPGAKLLHEGQFEGRKVKLPVFLCRRPEEPVNEELGMFYRRMLGIIHHTLFHKGYWQLHEARGWEGNDNYCSLLSWSWCDSDNRYLIVVNFSEQTAQGRIRIPGHDLKGRTWRLNDLIAERTYERSGDEMNGEGLYVSLGPWQHHLFRFYMV